MYLHQPNGSSYYRTRNVAPEYTAPRASESIRTVMAVMLVLVLVFTGLAAGFYAFYALTDIIPDGIIPEAICTREFSVGVALKFALIGAIAGSLIGFLFAVGKVLAARAVTTDTDPATGRIYQTGGPSKRQQRFSRGILFALWLVPLLIIGAGAGAGIYCLFAFGILPHDTITELVTSELVTWIGVGAIAGFALTCVFWVFNALTLEDKESEYYTRFIDVRNALPQGNIIFDKAGYPMEIITPGRNILMESRVWLYDSYSYTFFGDLNPTKLGQLILTNEALEFYDNDFIGKAHRSFIINLHDIAYARCGYLCKQKLIVYTKSGKYKFHVPIGTAVVWYNAILYAMQYGSRSLGPTAPRR